MAPLIDYMPLFARHASKCRFCRHVNPAKPATLAEACLEGSRLFKEQIHLVNQVDARAARTAS